MFWILIGLVGLSSFLLFGALLGMFFLSDKQMEKRMKHFLELNDQKKLSRRKFNMLVQLQHYKSTVRDRVLTKKKSERLETALARAGVQIKPEEYVMFQWISTFLAGGLLYLLSGQLFMLLPGAVFGFVLPRWMLSRKRQKRVAEFNEGLLDMLTTIIGSLRAGFSFAQALKTVVDESEGPIRDEAEVVMKEMQYGSSMEDALNEWKERMPSEDLDLMIQAILIQKQIGGNLAVILETIVQTIRDRGRIQRQVTTLTAQGRLSGVIIGLLPFALGLVIYVIEPEYIGTLFTHSIGRIMVGAGLVSAGIGFYFINKITKIEV